MRSTSATEEKKLALTLFAGDEKAVMGWEIYPPGRYDRPGLLPIEYHFPAFDITENGIAIDDKLIVNNEVHDLTCISFLERHPTQATLAIQAGLPRRGYFAWLPIDNFTWAKAYSKRFGLIYIDVIAQQKRILKGSPYWYGEWIS